MNFFIARHQAMCASVQFICIHFAVVYPVFLDIYVNKLTKQSRLDFVLFF